MIGIVDTRHALLGRGGIFARFIGRWPARRRAQRTYDESMALNDASLKDIGVQRSDIRLVAFRESLW